MIRASGLSLIVLLMGVTLVPARAADVAPIDPSKPPQKDPNTVLLLHFDKGEGTVAEDTSGLNNHGKISGGAAWVEGKFGKALQFDGVDDSVNCLGERHQPPHFDFGENTDFTVELWLNTTSKTRGAYVIGKKQRLSFDDPGFAIFLDNGGARAVVADGINQVGLVDNTQVTDGKWHHIALVVERKKNATLYIDGVKGPTADVSYLTDITNPKRELRIMDRGHDASTTGAVDEVRISNAARPVAKTDPRK